MGLSQYFDLRKPALGKKATTGGSVPAPGAPGQPLPAPATSLGIGWQIIVYVTLLLSIVASRYLDLYRAGTASEFGLDWPYLLSVAIVSLLAFPVVYDKAQLSRDRPIFLQLALIFTAGMGWEKIVATATQR